MVDRSTIAAVLDASFLGDFGELSTAELRDRRQQCEAVESELSYRRRVLHGHLDLLRAELSRRDVDAVAGPVTDLLDSLGEAMATASGRSPSHQRLDPAVTLGWHDEPDPVSADLPECSDDELRARGEALVARERLVSEQRRAVHGRLDQIQDEIVRRYREGTASIDEILPSQT